MFIVKRDTLQAISDSRDQAKRKEHFANLFNGAGWETDRIMAGLREADDFYLQEVAQAKCKTWLKGRVVLVGDTAYCPSPLSGMGITAAVVGSYVLAAKFLQHQDDHCATFATYEATVRPWIEEIQKIFPGAPDIGLPETQWVFEPSALFKIGEHFSSGGKKLKLPDPSVFERQL